MESDNLDYSFTRDLKDLQKSTNLVELFQKQEIPSDVLGSCQKKP